MPLFDRYLIVDWSAANTPKTGQDSIWICLCGDGCETVLKNISTRESAMQFVVETFEVCLSRGERIFAGFDFGFGFPRGMAKRFAGKASWKSVWSKIAEGITDSATNKSNRFEFADRINRDVFPDVDGPFWGHPHQHAGRYQFLNPKRPNYSTFPEKRFVEQQIKSAQPVWKLAYTGSVGSQTLLGIAHLEALRKAFQHRLSIWPFETRFSDDLDKPLTVAEVYPSLFPVSVKAGEVKDAAQVRTLALKFELLDQENNFHQLLSAPADMSAGDKDIVLNEEGWIVGAGHHNQEVTS